MIRVHVQRWSNERVDITIDPGADVSMMNAIRRTSQHDLWTVTFDRLHVLKNGFSVDDDAVHHRLQFTHLHRPIEPLIVPKKCVCGEKGCSRCQIAMEFRFEVPADAFDQAVTTMQSCRADPHGLRPQMTLGVLSREKELHMIAYARMNTGAQHASAVLPARSAFFFTPDIRIQSTIFQTRPEVAAAVAASCPTRVFEVNNKSGELKIVAPERCTFCKRCIHIAEEQNVHQAISVTAKPGSGRCVILSRGGVPAPWLLADSIDMLRRRIHTLRHVIAATLSQSVSTI